MFDPCVEHCYPRYGKQYSSECDGKCEYARIVKELADVKMERDAAVKDIRKLGDIGANICPICVNCNGREVLRKCSTCGYDVKNGNFEWRGVQKEESQ